MIKELILSKVKEYLQYKNIKFKKIGKMITFNCPYCKTNICNTIPYSSKIKCITCDKKFTLIDIVKEIEKLSLSDEEILTHIKEILKINTVTTQKEEKTLDTILDFYERSGFDLVPVAKDAKNPIEKDWTNKYHKDKEEWKQWINNGLNIGVKTGKISDITVIDIDAMPSDLKDAWYKGKLSESKKKEALELKNKKLKEILNILNHPEEKTLTQYNLGGCHLFFKYESDLPKTRIEEYKVDIENDGGQVVINPSIVGGQGRNFKNDHIDKFPDELLKIFKDKATVPRKTYSEELKEDIQTEDFKLKLFEEGTRNSSLIKLGGLFRKQLNLGQTKFVLHVLNNHNHRSGSHREIEAMANSLDKYVQFDEQELAHKVMEYLKEVKVSTKSDLELAIAGEWTKGEAKKTLNKIIQYLIKEGKIKQTGKKIQILEDLDWTDDLLNEGTPVDFKVPYFHDYAYFCRGDIIILGSQKKYGKTHLAMNMIKRLISQGIKPYYVYNEKQGGRFAKIALHLGMKDGDFWKARCSDPERLILRPDSVTIYDWVRPNKKEGFARTDLLFSELVQKTEKTNSFLICFVQLRRDNSFFAGDQIGQDTSLLARYVYEKDNEGTYTKFILDDTRERKFPTHSIEIPSIYSSETKEVNLVEELGEKEQSEIVKQLQKEREKR